MIIPENFKNRKLKVLMGCLSFKGLTGSEISTLETAKGLVENGCEVTIVSDIGGDLPRIAKKHGIEVTSISEPPCYKKGDGVWGFNTPKGQVKSEINKLYAISQPDFDVIHANHKPVTERLLQLYPNIPMVNFVRSEIISLEDPLIHKNIKKYVAIRPSIKEHLVNKFNIDSNLIEVIYNPFDETRFKPKTLDKGTSNKVILFVGTIDYLRKNTIYDISEYAKNNGKELWLVGKDSANYLDDLLQQTHIKHFEPTSKVEEYVKNASETAGILLGRTTIESWLCGKSSWIYDVDDKGLIKSKELHEPPEDVDKFIADNVARKIKEQYIKVLNEW